jgi:uncharacterized membrane protein YjjP (DUF1212 family)
MEQIRELTANEKLIEIKKAELYLAEYEEERKKLERNLNLYRLSCWLAGLGILASIFFFLIGWWGCSIILIPICAVAGIPDIFIVLKREAKIDEYDQRIQNARAYIRQLL